MLPNTRGSSHIQTSFLVERKDAHSRARVRQHIHMEMARRLRKCRRISNDWMQCKERDFDRKSTLTENTILDLVRPHTHAQLVLPWNCFVWVCVCVCVHFDCEVLLSTRCERDTTKVEERTVPAISNVLNWMEGNGAYAGASSTYATNRVHVLLCVDYNCCHRRLVARRQENAITERPSADVTAQRHPQLNCVILHHGIRSVCGCRFRRDQLRLSE